MKKILRAEICKERPNAAALGAFNNAFAYGYFKTRKDLSDANKVANEEYKQSQIEKAAKDEAYRKSTIEFAKIQSKTYEANISYYQNLLNDKSPSRVISDADVKKNIRRLKTDYTKHKKQYGT